MATATLPNESELRVLMDSYDLAKEEVILNVKRYDTILSLMPTLALAILVTIRQAHVPMVYTVIPFLFFGIAAMYIQSRFNITYISRYLCHLENRVNELVESEVMAWETKWVNLGLFYNRSTIVNGAVPFVIILALFVWSVVLGLKEGFHYHVALGIGLICAYLFFLFVAVLCYLRGQRALMKFGDAEYLNAEMARRLEGERHGKGRLFSKAATRRRE